MESFQYDPIIHEEHAFRLVRLFAGTGPEIQAEIIHVALDESDILEYEAVSYVWGSSELTSSIVVKGRILKITNNLELVLRDLRLPDQDRLLWIDGICIDQNRHKEKTHQVRQMRDIYQHAERVLFHIGHSTELTHILHETLLAIQGQQNLEPRTPIDLVWDKVEESLARQYTNFGTRLRNSVESILSTSWFRRVWIVQEVANARRALIYWGHASFQVAGFVHLVRKLGIKMDDHQASILDMMPQKRRSQSPWSHRQDLHNLLRRFKQAKATQNHDKIYALLGMCAGGNGHGTIVVDYEKSEDVVISEVVAYISFCEKEDLSGFCRNFQSVDRLLERIETLLQDLVVHMATGTRLAGLRSLLSNRKDEALVTESIVNVVVRNQSTGPAALGILLAHAPNRTMVSIDVLRRAVIEANRDILRVVDTYKSDPKIVDAVMNSGPVIRTYNGTGSDEEIIQDLLNSSTPLSRHLCLAARDGLIDAAKKSLEEGADVNTIGPEGLTPLGCAAANGQRDMIEFLLASRAHIETGYQSPLSLAVEHGQKDTVQLLMNRGADIESCDRYGRTPLSLSASGGCRAILSLGRSEIGQERLRSIMKRNDTYHLPGGFERIVESSRVVGVYRNDDTRTYDPGFVSHQISEVYSEIFDLLLEKGADMTMRDCLFATPLWWATNYGHLPVVDTLLRKRVEARVRDIYGLVPLSWALWNGHQAVVKRFLDSRTKVDLDGGNNSLFWATCNGSETQVQWLIDKGLDMKVGATVSWAASSGHASTVKLLLDMNASTVVCGVEPALLLAASTGHEAVVKVLLDYGEDVEFRNAIRSTPLMLAARGGHYGTVQLLLDRTAKVNSRDYYSQTPLMYAADGGSPDVVKVIIKNHAEVDTNTGDLYGFHTSLLKAAHNGHHQVVQLLLEHGANIEGNNSFRITLLMMACNGGHEAAARLLLEQNANVNATTQSYKRTALFYSARRGDQKIVRLLLEHGADTEICDHQGATPLMMACRSGHEETVGILLEHNAKVNTVDLKGCTALDQAEIGGHKSVKRMLRKSLAMDLEEDRSKRRKIG